MRYLAFVVVTLIAASGTASAQSRKSADRVHDFHTMDRQTPMTSFGFALGIQSWDDAPLFPLDAMVSLDFHGQYVSEGGAGGYVLLPLSYVATDDVMIGPILYEGDSQLAIGNIELGGLYAGRLGKQADMVFHGGVALPTATDGTDDVGTVLQPFVAAGRFADLVDRLPNGTWLRAGISPMGRAGMFFWRFDLGIDLMIDDDDDTAEHIDPVVRINAGGGIDVGKADVTVELDNNIIFPDDEDRDETASTIAIGGRFKGGTNGTVQPGLAIVLPVGFDDPGYEEFEFAVLASVTARAP